MILAINTASSHTAIALLENSEILAETSWKSENNEAEKLMPAIHKLLDGRPYNEIKKIIVVKGPGSFTGLRIGVTVANTIAFLTSADLYAIDTFEYHWKKLNENPQSTALLIFAGSRGVYVDLPSEDEPININLDELNKFLTDNKIEKTFGDITDEQKSILEVKFQNSSETFAETILKFDLEKLPKVQLVQPRYIKPPSITTPKNALHSLNTNR